MAGRTPSPGARIASRSGLEHLAWGLSLMLHGAVVIALGWNAPPMSGRSSQGSASTRCIELFDSSSLRLPVAVEQRESVQQAAFLTSSAVHATLSPPPEALPQPIREPLVVPSGVPANLTSDSGEPS